MPKQLAKAYSHNEVEGRWYLPWVEGGLFRPAPVDGHAFSMVIPPPNVTGSLHMGHALNNTLQDILCRYKRMDGYSVLWVPGTDHAGIATQNVVERELANKGLNRFELGRDKFIERVWEWREQTGSTILNQLKALGVSCDWSRERFTMDEGLSRAVREAFVGLWKDGLLYRAERLINWCPRCKTALADIEVVHEESDGHLWHIRYPLQDQPSEGLVVATTRPETMLGDTAVAVHPEDKRYLKFIGRTVSLPIVNRPIPVIADSFVDPQFGTGALKITPGHDFNDFEIGERHGLDIIGIFDDEAKISPAGFKDEGAGGWLENYAHKDRMEARRLVVEELKQNGLLVKVEPYRNAVGHCYRCHTVIEPYSTPQWFVKIQPLADPAIEAVRSGKTKIIPEGWANSYFAWMENIKDWCISRQIWWGHQIPAWYCNKCEQGNALAEGASADRIVLGPHARPIVQLEPPKSCPNCRGKEFIQDPDVLDTWFSSALWPFSTLGWPKKTKDLKSFYPTSVLVTGFDILFFWVARMIMMGIKFMGDIPFRHVYIHALVRDMEGQKMSKSKGNVIDPLEVMGRYGTDAFRFTLASLAAMGRDIKLAEERIAGYQNFVNKLWNASRFALMNISDEIQTRGKSSAEMLQGKELNLADQWILSRLASTVVEARKAIDSYRFNEYAQCLYQFTWHEFCDWYIEMSKLSLNGRLKDDPLKTQTVLVVVLREVLLLLHPLMPFVTEEIWRGLTLESGKPSSSRGPKKGLAQNTIMVQPYPKPETSWIQPAVEEKIGWLTDVIRAIRNLRTEMNCSPGKEVEIIVSGSAEDLTLLQAQEPYIRALARVAKVEYRSPGQGPQNAATSVVGSTEIYLPFSDLVNLEEEETRLAKELGKVESELTRTQGKLSNEQFRTKAKQEVIEKEERKAEELAEKIQTLTRSLKRVQELKSQGRA